MNKLERQAVARRFYFMCSLLAVQAVVSAAGWVFYYAFYLRGKPGDPVRHALVLAAVLLIGGVLLENFRTLLAARRRVLALGTHVTRYEKLLAMVSRDTATVLDGVRRRANELEQNLQSTGDREAAANIAQRTEQAQHLLEDFFNIDRLEDQLKQPVDPSELLDAAVATVAVRPEMSKIAFRKAYPRTLPPLSADPGQMTELFCNLIRNLRRLLPDCGDIVVEVDDQRGSSAEAGAGSFTVSFRGKARQATEGEVPQAGVVPAPAYGMGLGLAVGRSIAESHGGSVEANFLPEGGAEVRLQLKT